jgi:RNA polymerase sigma-70 factor (ECF subfamily)
MLGSATEAEDAVQDAWLRLSGNDGSGIENLGGWLTTVVSRVCLDMLRSRTSRREDPIDIERSPRVSATNPEPGPEQQSLMADAVGPALLTILDTLQPADRLAFVLHDMFGVPFDEIAMIVDRSPAAARQLASRARRRVKGLQARPESDTNPEYQRHVVDAFLAASRDGDFAGLLAVLDPDIEFRSDLEAVRLGGLPVVRGAREFAEHFSGTAKAARPVLVNGAIGAVWAPGGKPKVVLDLVIVDGKIISIDAIADPAQLEALNLEFIVD